MTQQQIYTLFQKNPFYPLSAESVKHELRSEKIELNIQSISNNLKRLEKSGLIKKHRNFFWYPENEDEVNKIIEQSQYLYTNSSQKEVGIKDVIIQKLQKVRRFLLR